MHVTQGRFPVGGVREDYGGNAKLKPLPETTPCVRFPHIIYERKSHTLAIQTSVLFPQPSKYIINSKQYLIWHHNCLESV